jgi:hypothetical protein
MLWFLALASALSISPVQTQASGPINVTTIVVGAPKTVAELDLGKLKGDLRQIGWSADGTKLYVQTVDGDPPSEKLRHYIVPVEGGAVQTIEQQKAEKTKIGTGSGRPGATGSDGPGSGVDVEKTSESQSQMVFRLMLYGEAVSEFVNTRVIPGLMFSWGPDHSAAIAYTTPDGRLFLLDRDHHKQTVSGAKDALLPAWSIDGTRLAWVQKSGRKKYTLVWASVSKG